MFVFQTHTDLFQEIILFYLILTRDNNIICSSCVNLKQISVVFDAKDLSDNVKAILKSMQNGKIAAKKEHASRFGLATSLAIFAILHTFQYGRRIVGKVYG